MLIEENKEILLENLRNVDDALVRWQAMLHIGNNNLGKLSSEQVRCYLKDHASRFNILKKEMSNSAFICRVYSIKFA